MFLYVYKKIPRRFKKLAGAFSLTIPILSGCLRVLCPLFQGLKNKRPSSMLSCDAPERPINSYGANIAIFSEMSNTSRIYFISPHKFFFPVRRKVHCIKKNDMTVLMKQPFQLGREM